MYKKVSFVMVLFCLGVFLNSAAAQKFSIRDWVFTSYTAQVEDVRMDIEKNREARWWFRRLAEKWALRQKRS